VTTVCCHGPNFLPWLGYFDKMRQVDVFCFVDTAQVGPESRRTRILGPHGPDWLTVPTTGSAYERIDRVAIASHQDWQHKLAGKLQTAYGKHPFWSQYGPGVQGLLSGGWLAGGWVHMADLAEASIGWLAGMLGVHLPKIVRASELGPDPEDREQRILAICQAVGADRLFSGPNSRQYRDYGLFKKNGIEVVHHDYNHPEYPQKGQAGFVPYLSAVDALMNVGARASKLLIGRSVPV
jgi:hypothetical protein